MSTRYLLPCPCGESIPVETPQAGQVVRCACGRDLEVPTLLKLRSLERIEEEQPTVARGSWGVAQGLTLVGAVAMLGTIAGGVYFYVHRPVAPEAVFTEKIIERDFQRLSVLQSDELWAQLRLGLGNSRPVGPAYRHALKTYQIPRYATINDAYEDATKQYHIRLGVALVILALAAATTIWGLIAVRARAREASRAKSIASSA